MNIRSVLRRHLGSCFPECCRLVGSMDSPAGTKYYSSDCCYWQRDRHCFDHTFGQSVVCLDISRWLAIGFLCHRCVAFPQRIDLVHASIFLSGLVSCLWFVGWSFFAFNSPSEHPRITYEEKLYLLRSVPKPKKVRRK